MSYYMFFRIFDIKFHQWYLTISSPMSKLKLVQSI